MLKNTSAILALAFAVAVGGFSQASAAPAKDFSGSTEYHLIPCASATELDCVESFGFINKAGGYVAAKSELGPSNTYTDQNGNKVLNQSSQWSAEVDGILASVGLDVPLQAPKYVIFKNPDGTVHYGASLRPMVMSNDLLNTNVRFEIRTSYLIPQNVQLVAEDSDFSQTKIAGGNLWMFQGKGTAVSAYANFVPGEDFSRKADFDLTTLHFIIHHGDRDLSRGYWPAVCGDKGYTVQAFNSNSAGSPSWNNQSKSLNFAIESPHSKASGASNLGFFKLWTSDAYVNCKWPGNDLTGNAKLEVRIISEDGTAQTSTNQVTHTNGKIFVSASGFHYSAPTIKLVNATTLASNPSIKTIKCLKGKSIKLVSGKAPKCPTGYKVSK